MLSANCCVSNYHLLPILILEHKIISIRENIAKNNAKIAFSKLPNLKNNQLKPKTH